MDTRFLPSGGTPGEFARPGPANAPAAYWFWHRVPTEDEVREQIEGMRRAGYQSFQIQARMSMPLNDYLGDEYLRMCALAADVAADKGMVIGIYDEYNWLSGHAGGRVVDGHDGLRERHLFHVTARVDAGGRARARIDGIHATDVDYLLDQGKRWVFEGGEPLWDEWRLVAAVRHTGAGGATSGDVGDVVDVTGLAGIVAADDASCDLGIDLGGDHGHGRGLSGDGRGEWVTFFVAARCRTSRMINYLDPAAAERFVEVGYEPYARAFGAHMGSTVAYVFFDQPHACFFDWAQNEGTTASTLMYDESFYDALAADFGDEWPRALMAWVRDVGDDTASLRARFWQAYGRRAIDSFLGTLNRWCRAHGLLLSGHEVLSHVSSWDPTSTIIADDPRTNFALDYFALDAWRDVTGVDARNEYPQLSAKFGDSAARAHGRSGCIVEQYFGRVVKGSHFAAGWWELTLDQLRSAAMRHHALGMRQLLMHAFWLTDGHDPEPGEDGRIDDKAEMFVNPRFDFAPGVNYEPWFVYHRRFADESARVSVFLDGARPLDEVAVLYPLRTDWAHGPSHCFGRHMAMWCEGLARAGVDYAVVDEDDLARATADGGRLRLPDGRRFEALVLPGVETLRDAASMDVIEAFLDAGGRVVSSGPLPRETQRTGLDPALRERASRLADGIRWHHGADGAGWDELLADVSQGLEPKPAVVGESCSDGQLWVRRGVEETTGAVRFMLFNDADMARDVTIATRHEAATASQWDPATGSVGDATHVGPMFTVRLKPHEVRLLRVEPDGPGVPAELILRDGWLFGAARDVADAARGANDAPISPFGGWQSQGFMEVCGTGRYSLDFELTDPGETDWLLELPHVRGSVEVWVNGAHIASEPWAGGPVDVPLGALVPGANGLTLLVTASAANRYYRGTAQQGDGPAVCGLDGAPVLRPALPCGTLAAPESPCGRGGTAGSWGIR